MSSDGVLKLSQEKFKLAINSYVIAFILMAIIIILFIIFLHKRKKQIWSKIIINYLIPIVFILPMVLTFLVEGVNANRISNMLKIDSSEMVTLTTSGKIDDTYDKAKTSFIVIDSKSFIYDSYLLKANIAVGEQYKIKYLSNSGFIIKLNKISDDGSH